MLGSSSEDGVPRRPAVHRSVRRAARVGHRCLLLEQPRHRLLLRRPLRHPKQSDDPQPPEHPELLHGSPRLLDGSHPGGRAPRPPDHLCAQLRGLGARALELSRPQPAPPLRGRPARVRARARPRVVAGSGAWPLRGRAHSGRGGRALLRPGAPQHAARRLRVGALRAPLDDALPGSVPRLPPPAMDAGRGALRPGAPHQGDRRHAAGDAPDPRLRLPRPHSPTSRTGRPSCRAGRPRPASKRG